MSASPQSLTELNSRYREFWAVEQANVAQRASQPWLLAAAMEELQYEAKRNTPIYDRRTLEFALARADERRARIKDEVKSEVRNEDGKRGGRPRIGDSLQCLIEEMVANYPTIKVSALLDRLRKQERGEVVDFIEDGQIYFKHRDRDVISPISGLKDRLARARKSLKSRKPV